MAPEEQMAREQQSPLESPARPVPGKADPDDLSSEIVAYVEKQAGDVVKCRRIDKDNYRCNWWAAQATGGYDNPGMFGLLVTTHRVRKSQFLRVTRSPTRGLVVQVLDDRLK
jgi:hypothetical protein